MEKRLNVKIEEYVTKFKNEIRTKAIGLEFEDNHKVAELMEFIYDYNRLTLQKDDLVKRKRVKNSIPELNRCTAKRASGEQCTRRRKDECEFCGTHSKGTPHGLMQSSMDNTSSTNANQKMEVFAEEIKGIVYYLDKHGNVYKTEDILANTENPRIVAKWVKSGEIYTIPELGLI